MMVVVRNRALLTAGSSLDFFHAVGVWVDIANM
jgi:hypothetical protein